MPDPVPNGGSRPAVPPESTGPAPEATAGPLGRPAVYPGHYDPGLLFAIDRAPQRAALGIGARLPFMGADVWNAYELGWLDPRGRPHVGVLECVVPADSPRLIESKSFKLYLNSFNQEKVTDAAALATTLIHDLSECCGARVGLMIRSLAELEASRWRRPEAESIQDLDRLDLECSVYHPDPGLLRADFDLAPHQEILRSDLLRTNCPVTGQPDWGSLEIRYAGPPIDHGSLLRYIVSYREHNDFHEHCVERIYCDLMARCRPIRLTVRARYTRRGGLDINPMRTSHPGPLLPNLRTIRQ